MNDPTGADAPQPLSMKLDEESIQTLHKSTEEKSMQASPSSSNLSGEMGRIENYEEGPTPPISDSAQEITPNAANSTGMKITPTYHTLSIHVISPLMLFSVFGTLARLGIHALATYPAQSIFPLAWVQAVGCLIMGFTLAVKEPITRFYGPLYTGITTGFCGSLTTFSGWQLDIFLAWGHGSGVPKLWIYDVMDGLTRLLFTLAISMSSFNLGVHLGKRILRCLSVPPPTTAVVRWAFTSLSIIIYALTIPFFVRLNSSWRSQVTAALLFSFPGTLTRYILSTQLNPRIQLFPVGTLIANELATAILIACHITQRAPDAPNPVACSILQGFIDGYCGCLSTVSTFVTEIRLLKGRKSWLYVIVSLGIGQILCLVLLGPVWWSGRIQESNLCRAS